MKPIPGKAEPQLGTAYFAKVLYFRGYLLHCGQIRTTAIYHLKEAELGLGVPGKHFWMREYWDRYIRDENHFHSTIAYIHDNPVKAGLCAYSYEWPWSSAAKYPQRYCQ